MTYITNAYSVPRIRITNVSTIFQLPAELLPAASRGHFQEEYRAGVNPIWVRLLKLPQMNVSHARNGADLFTEEGNRVLGWLSGYCARNLRHNRPAILDAIKDELDHRGPAMLQSHILEHDGLARRHFGHGGAGRLIRLGGLVLVFFLGGLSTCLRAQETASNSVSNLVLQDASRPGNEVQSPGSEAVQAQSSASIAGTVRDAQGALVPGVQVTLVGQNNAVDRMLTADSKGAFTFAELAPGTYHLKISAVGREPSLLVEVVLGAGERRELPIVGTRIPTTSTTVHVVATPNEVAQAQVREQEKQRVLGVLSNYYSSYIWDAAPMTPKLKFKLTLRSTTDPVSFLVAAGVAGVEQKHNTFPGYGHGTEGYAKRFGAAYTDTVVSKMVSRAILPTVLHQDPRYFYRGSGSIRSRIFYALAATVICRGDNGRLQANYSQVLGNFAASGISNLYRAPGDRTASLTFRNGLIMTASGAVENLLREFLSRKLTPNVPAFANGKP